MSATVAIIIVKTTTKLIIIIIIIKANKSHYTKQSLKIKTILKPCPLTTPIPHGSSSSSGDSSERLRGLGPALLEPRLPERPNPELTV